MTIDIKSVRDAPCEADGYRVLVDRLWPRGLTKEAVAHDVWLKEVGASGELRRWFRGDPSRFEAFEHRYRQELECGEALADLRRICREHASVTLLVDSREPERSKAAVLRDLLTPCP